MMGLVYVTEAEQKVYFGDINWRLTIIKFQAKYFQNQPQPFTVFYPIRKAYKLKYK